MHSHNLEWARDPNMPKHFLFDQIRINLHYFPKALRPWPSANHLSCHPPNQESAERRHDPAITWHVEACSR